jgi:hypothetical protein
MQLRVCGSEGQVKGLFIVVFRAPPGEWRDVRKLLAGRREGRRWHL